MSISTAAVAVGGTALKAITPHMWKILIGAGFIVPSVVGQIDKSGERNLTREQMAASLKVGGGQKEVDARRLKESRANTQDYLNQIKDLRRKETAGRRDDELLQAYLGSQERQAQNMMQTILGLSQVSSANSPRYQGPNSFLGLLRS